jgi:hypothetical protein
VEGAEDLHVGSADAMTWIVRVDVREGNRCGADSALLRLATLFRVAVLGLSQAVDVMAGRNSRDKLSQDGLVHREVGK